jgi:hypothetical protein
MARRDWPNAAMTPPTFSGVEISFGDSGGEGRRSGRTCQNCKKLNKILDYYAAQLLTFLEA